MKFKTYTNRDLSYKTSLCCLDWSGSEEFYSVGEGNCILKWNSFSRDFLEIAKLPDNFVPTDLHWSLNRNNAAKDGDSLLISSNDGRFVILNKSARLERNVLAHSATITSSRWSSDGTSLLTAGEDGFIKIWSRSGMLRSTVVQSDDPVRCARWSPLSTAIVFAQGSSISIKPLAANSKIIKWRAHDDLVLCVSWSSYSNLIASGGQDLRYKIWDTQGKNIFTSLTNDYAITSIEFCPVKDLLAVGGFNVLKLCSKNGWSYSSSKFDMQPLGSTYGIAWSPDGTQIASGTSTGNIIFGHLVDMQLISRNLKATATEIKTILLQDITSGASDVLDFPDRIINFALGYGHMIVATSNQIHIFNENYINTPIIVDGRSDVRLMELGKKFFVVVDLSSIWIYTYTGRLHFNPRFPGVQAQVQSLNSKTISIGMHIFSIRDITDQTKIHIFELVPGPSQQSDINVLIHKTQISELAACRSGHPQDQLLAFIDINQDLFITSCYDRNDKSTNKIGAQVLTIKWSSETNILIGMHDTCYSIWYCPGEGCSNAPLIPFTTVTVDSTEYGQNIVLQSFEGSLVSFWSAGSLFRVNVDICCEVMLRVLIDEQWQKAVKICRFAKNSILWATLAAIATKKNQFGISEEAYSAALQIDKVKYLQYIRSFPVSSSEHMAENSLLLGRLVESETILINNHKYREAISICVRMHNWKRAIEIAEKNNIDKTGTILNHLNKYLKDLGEQKTDKYLL